MSYELAIARTEQVVRQLSNGATPLANALALFEEGVQHLRLAEAALAEIEKRAKRLTNSEAPDDDGGSAPDDDM